MIKILIAVVSSFVCGILPSIWPDVHQSWEVYAICTRIEVFTWILVLYLFIQFRKLLLKSVVLCLCIFELIDILNMIALWGSIQSPYILYSIKSVLCILILIRYIFRNYEKRSDVLDEEHFFSVGIIPNSLQDFILSLIKDPVGGIGIYANNKFYHYKKGNLVVHDKKYLERINYKYRIKKIRRIDKKRLTLLDSLIDTEYSKWSWFLNCKTVLEPILGNRGKPLFILRGNESWRRKTPN